MVKPQNSKRKSVKKEDTTPLSEDMDTDDLLDHSDTIIAPSNQDNGNTEEDIDILLDSIDEQPPAPKKKGRATKKKADDESTNTKGRKKAAATPKGKATAKGKGKAEKVEKKLGYELKRSKELAEQYPDTYWKYHADDEYGMIGAINKKNQLELVPCNISDQGAVTGMTISPNGQFLATFSTMGSIKVWNIADDLKLLRKLRDGEEPHIEEFYCGQFLEDVPGVLVAGGKLKDRHRWSTEDNDNHITPSPIKIFDIETGKVIAKLHGHDEEILCIKAIRFNGENHYISTSQDGHIIKWRMADDWITLVEMTKMEEELTCMAFNVSFVPNTGNKYFIAACDEHIRLYDFEHAKLIQTFENLYSSYCDCAKFINWLDEPLYWEGLNDSKKVKAAQKEQYAWVISRGAELCHDETGVATVPNTCALHRLVYPKKEGDLFVLEEVKRYAHKNYHSNSWLVQVTSNGRYLLAPTIYGQTFVFNLLSGQLTATLKNHEDMEVRDVKFHPYASLLFSTGDDGMVCAYTYKDSDEEGDKTMEDGSAADTQKQDDQVNQDLSVGTTSSSPSTN